MNRLAASLLLIGLLDLATRPALALEVGPVVESELAPLVETYRTFHRAPELSRHEKDTAARFAAELRRAGYTVTENIGRYDDGTPAFGVVGVLENGPGPRLLLRSDMDGLPVTEETGADYASRVRTHNAAGQEVGVMHACGHDIHMTSMIGTARALATLRSHWSGTLMIVGQPAEETGEGSRAMLADRLYERFGQPDLAIAMHDTNARAAGTVSVTSGPAMSSVTSVDVVLRGVGGHGARPQDVIDPIVMAGEFIVQLQTIVSRQEDPRDPTIVTIGAIHGGTKRNIIPNEVTLELSTRAFSDKARNIILDGIRRTAAGVALAAGVPADRAPTVTVIDHETTPVTFNDPALTSRVRNALEKALGTQNVLDEPLVMVSEDFDNFALTAHRIPAVLFWLGAADPAAYAAAVAAGKLPPGLHTSRFLPAPEATLRTGVTAMTSVALTILAPAPATH